MRTEVTTKERLLAAARDLYLEVGPIAFSLREVARRSKVTAAAVYRHYENKDALLGAVCAEGFRVFASYLMGALSKPKPLDRMRETGQQYLRFALERPRDYRVIFMGDAIDPDPSATAPDASFQFLVDRVSECQQAKVIAKGEPEELAITIWAHVHGLVSLRLAGHLAPVGSEDDFRALYTRSTDAVLASLAP